MVELKTKTNSGVSCPVHLLVLEGVEWGHDHPTGGSRFLLLQRILRVSKAKPLFGQFTKSSVVVFYCLDFGIFPLSKMFLFRFSHKTHAIVEAEVEKEKK